MKHAKVSDLQNQLSRYLDYVRHGETVLVLNRNIPVAELRPLSQKSSREKLTVLERKGIIRRRQKGLPKKFLNEVLGGKRAGVLKTLLEERKYGR